MAKVDLTLKEMRTLLNWTEEFIREAERLGDDYSESWANQLGVLQGKLSQAFDEEADALAKARHK